LGELGGWQKKVLHDLKENGGGAKRWSQLEGPFCRYHGRKKRKGGGPKEVVKSKQTGRGGNPPTKNLGGALLDHEMVCRRAR